jgi:hypothetical protein|tara:strand:+ start:1503 stop:2273 length:771 start_codon:yes stop_codon:yes gene_type:complete
MKKVLFTIARYEDQRQDFFEKYTRPKNKRYCQKNGFEYIEYNDDGHKHRDSLTRSWDKFGKVRELMEDGHLKPGDIVTNIDADMCLVDEDCPLVTNKTFSYAIDSCNTHCMGAYSLKINEWGMNLVRLILDEDRYNKYKDHKTIGSMGEMSSFWEIFGEQASWYSLAGIKRHSWVPFVLMPHYGWHSETNEDTVYSLKELYENVEVLDPNWNVTHIPEEDGQDQFYMLPTRKEDVIIRHFAGGRTWRADYFTGEEQ